MIRSSVLAAISVSILLAQGCANNAQVQTGYWEGDCNSFPGPFNDERTCIPKPSPAPTQPAYVKSNCDGQSHFSDRTCIPANDPLANAAEEILGLKQTPTGQPLDLQQSIEVGEKGIEKEVGLKPGQ